MIYITKVAHFLLLIVFQIIAVTSISQNKVLVDSLDLKLLNSARDIMVNAKICSLITLDKEGRPRARAMDPFLPEDDFTVWLGTNSNSRKVTQIKNDSRVTLYYFDTEIEGYVVINGTAKLITDLVFKEKYWKKKWEAFYPNKQKDYMLIKVVPIWLEILSSTHGIYNDPTTWQPPTVEFD